MHFRLRTLLILLAIGPMVLAATWLNGESVLYVAIFGAMFFHSFSTASSSGVVRVLAHEAPLFHPRCAMADGGGEVRPCR